MLLNQSTSQKTLKHYIKNQRLKKRHLYRQKVNKNGLEMRKMLKCPHLVQSYAGYKQEAQLLLGKPTVRCYF